MTSADLNSTLWDVVVVGGGPAGATAANDLARAGHAVVLLDRAGRIKPCGGAVPPRLIKDFEIPEELLVARIDCARMVAPSARQVDMQIDDGVVGMVDREHFDEWLRERARAGGATRVAGDFSTIHRGSDGSYHIAYKPQGATGEHRRSPDTNTNGSAEAKSRAK